MSWEPTWVPDGRGGFNRQRPEDESEEPTDEEEGEISGRNEFRPRFGPRGRGFVGHHRGGGRGGGGRGEFFFREPAVQGNFPPRQPFREGPFRAERGRATSVGGFHRPPELHREGSFGVTTRTDHHRDGSFARDVPPFRDMAAPVRDPMFGARNDGPPRELTREGPFGPRGGDLPLREPMREPSFGPRVDMGGLPPREIGREGSFGLRGADIGGPPRDTLREPPFGPRGDSGGPARDSGRDGAFGPRGTDIGGQMRDHVRETSFGPRGLDQGGPAREIGPRGPGAPFTRGGTPLARDGGPPPPIPFHRNDTPRETSFSDLAGPLPPRDRPFRDESTPRGRVVSQGPGYPTTIPLTAPADPRRPTDPRRRSSHDLGGLNSAGPPHISGDGPNDGPPLTNPQPGRRLGSYSSLADNSTIPTNPMPAPAPLHSTGEAFRSPVGRRIQQDQAPRNTDPFNGPPLTQTRQPSWSPAIERRTLSGSPRNVPSIKVPGFNSEHPPSAPPLSRGGSFRDPRFKSNDNPDSRPDLNSTPAVFPSRNKSLSVSEDLGTGRTRQPLPKSSPKSSPTKPVVQSSPSKEDPKISELLPAAPELSASKLNTPLLTSALGHGDIVQRAETAVLHLSEVVDSKDIKAADGLSKLPAKQMIMTAVTEIEKLIKETQQELERLHDEHKDAVKEQVKDDELEQKRLEAKEDMRITEVEQRQKQEAKLQEHLKVKGLQRAIEERQEDFDNARKKLEEEFEQRIEQAKMDQQSQFEQKLEAHVNNVQQGWNKDIVKARNFVEKAKSSTVRLEAKVAAAESEYQSFLESAQNETDQPKSRPTSSQGGSMPSLVEQIIADNHRKAKEAQMMTFSIVSENDPPFIESDPGSGGPKDPALGETCEEWSVLAKQVTGFADALYTEPSEAPYYQKNERSHALLGPTIKECIRDQKRQLVENWTVLAEEYEVRKRLYDKQQRKLAKKAQRGSVSVVRKSIFAGDKESSTHGQSGDKGNILESGRSSNNPYRRARRGNEVRSEYEQEQIIAEIAAKEAMEKRITFGSCKLPRQIVRLERVSFMISCGLQYIEGRRAHWLPFYTQGLIATYINTFNSYKVDDPLKEDQESRMNNVWTDMEKCIFLDRFLQFPKDFRRIASFLRNKTTKDCVAFYYDSKQTVAYKGALKEHVMRRKRKGDYAIWDASIQAALSVGAIVTAGLNEEKPLEFSLPPSDRSYRTYMLHPLQQPVLESMPIDEEAARQHEAEARPEEAKVKSKKRFRDPLFSLDKEHTKFLRLASQESMSGVIRVKSAPVEEEEEEKEKAITEPEPEELHELNSPPTPVRKAPQKWTTAEKRIFAETLEQYGKPIHFV